jgi:hypothetical protein
LEDGKKQCFAVKIECFVRQVTNRGLVKAESMYVCMIFSIAGSPVFAEICAVPDPET